MSKAASGVQQKKKVSFTGLSMVVAVMFVGGFFLLGGSFAGGVGETIEAGEPIDSGNSVLSCTGNGADGSYVQLGSAGDDLDCS